MEAVVSTPPEDIAQFGEKARSAQRAWSALSLNERIKRIEALAQEVLRRGYHRPVELPVGSGNYGRYFSGNYGRLFLLRQAMFIG